MIKGARTECVKKPSGKKLSACEENLNLRKGKETTLGKPGELLRNASPQSIWGKMELVKRNKGRPGDVIVRGYKLSGSTAVVEDEGRVDGWV